MTKFEVCMAIELLALLTMFTGGFALIIPTTARAVMVFGGYGAMLMSAVIGLFILLRE